MGFFFVGCALSSFMSKIVENINTALPTKRRGKKQKKSISDALRVGKRERKRSGKKIKDFLYSAVPAKV